MTMLLTLAATALVAADPGPRIEATADPTRVEVSAAFPAALLARLPEGRLTQEQGERRLRLSLVPQDGTEGPAILGSYERRGGVICFTPRYALAHGQSYRATAELDGRTLTADHRVPPRAAAPRAAVEKVYPTADELPANQLKFYVHFSRPMREGREIFDHFQILGEDGTPVLDPWRRTELWNEDGRRLTLWIHPGRIKEGVKLREELGPVLVPGRRYTLVVGPKLLDADGQPLAAAFTKKFRAGEPLRTLPRVEDWTVRPPRAGTAQPLVVEFPRPMDRALLDRLVRVLDGEGSPVAGRVEVGPEERTWLFHPEQPWRAAAYSVAVDSRLEDLAGNTPLRPFDVDLEARRPAASKLQLPFRCD
jgi:hypothetical protein